MAEQLQGAAGGFSPVLRLRLVPLVVVALQILAGCTAPVAPLEPVVPPPGPETLRPEAPAADRVVGDGGRMLGLVPGAVVPILERRDRQPEPVALAPPPRGVLSYEPGDAETASWKAALGDVGDTLRRGVATSMDEPRVVTAVTAVESSPSEFLVETRHAGTTRWFAVVPGSPRVLDLTGSSPVGDLVITVTLDAQPGAVGVAIQPTAAVTSIADVALRLHAILGDAAAPAATCGGSQASVSIGMDTNGEPVPDSWLATVRFLAIGTIVEGQAGASAGNEIHVNVTPTDAHAPLGLIGGALTGVGRVVDVALAQAPGNATAAPMEPRCVPDASTSDTSLDVKLDLSAGNAVPGNEASFNFTGFRAGGTSVVSVGWKFGVRYDVSGFVVTDNRADREGGRLEFSTPSSSYAGWVRVVSYDEGERLVLRSWLDDSMHLRLRHLPWTVRDAPNGVVDVRAWHLPYVVDLEIVGGTSLRVSGWDHDAQPMAFGEIVLLGSRDPSRQAPPLEEETGAASTPYQNALRIDRERDEIEARAFQLESLSWSTGRLMGCGIRVEPVATLGGPTRRHCLPSADPFHRFDARLLNSGDVFELTYRSEAADAGLVVEGLPRRMDFTTNFGTTWRYEADSEIARVLAQVETPIHGEGLSFQGGPRPVAGTKTLEVEIRGFSQAITLETDLRAGVSYVADRPIGYVRVTTGEVRIVSELTPLETNIDGQLPLTRPGLPAFEVSARGLPAVLDARADLEAGTYRHEASGRIGGINLNLTRPEGIGETLPQREPYTRVGVEISNVPPRLVAKWPTKGGDPHVSFVATEDGEPAQVGELRLYLTSRFTAPVHSVEHELLIIDYAHERTLAARSLGTSSLRFDLVDAEAEPGLGPDGLRFHVRREGLTGGNVAVALRMLGGDSNVTLNFEGRVLSPALVADAEVRDKYTKVQFGGHVEDASFLACFANVSWGPRDCDAIALTIQSPEIGPGTTTFVLDDDEIRLETPRPTDVSARVQHAKGLGAGAFRPKLVEVSLRDIPPAVEIHLKDVVLVLAYFGSLTGSFYVSEALDAGPSSPYRNYALVREDEDGVSAIKGQVNGLLFFGMCNEQPEVDCGGEGSLLFASVVDPAGDAANLEVRVHNSTYTDGSDLKLRIAVERELPQWLRVAHRTGDPDPTAKKHVRYLSNRSIGETATDASVNIALRTKAAADYAYYFEKEKIESRVTWIDSGWGVVDAGLVRVPQNVSIEWSTNEGPVDYHAFHQKVRLRDCPAGYVLDTLTLRAKGGPLVANRVNVVSMPTFRSIVPTQASPEMRDRTWPLLSSDRVQLVPDDSRHEAAATLFSCTKRPPSTDISLGWWVRGGNGTARLSSYTSPDVSLRPFNTEDPHSYYRGSTVLLCDFHGAVSFWFAEVNGQNNRNGGNPEGHWEISAAPLLQNGDHHLCERYGFFKTELPHALLARFPVAIYAWDAPP